MWIKLRITIRLPTNDRSALYMNVQQNGTHVFKAANLSIFPDTFLIPCIQIISNFSQCYVAADLSIVRQVAVIFVIMFSGLSWKMI